MDKAPGWYADPVDAPNERHWNGEGWTTDTRPPGGDAPAPPAAPASPAPRRTGGPRSLLAAALLVVALALAGAGFAFGLMPVKAGVGASCGSGFSDDTNSFELTGTGLDTCARERSDRQALATGVLIAAGVFLIGSGAVAYGASGRDE